MDRRKGSAWFLWVYRHTKLIGYRVPCPSVHVTGSSCVLCKDSGEIGFFRAERLMKKSKGEKP